MHILQVCLKALAEAKGDPIYLTLLNRLESRKEEKFLLYDLAMDDTQMVLKLDPKFWQAHFLQGYLFLKKSLQPDIEKGESFENLNEKAIEAFTSVLLLQGSHAGSLTLRGMAYMNSGVYDEAIADYNAAMKSTPPIPLCFFITGA